MDSLSNVKIAKGHHISHNHINIFQKFPIVHSNIWTNTRIIINSGHREIGLVLAVSIFAKQD